MTDSYEGQCLRCHNNPWCALVIPVDGGVICAACARVELDRVPRCACGRPASYLGRYEGHGRFAFACDTCCGHGNEDGMCWPLAELSRVVGKLHEEVVRWESEMAFVRKHDAEIDSVLILQRVFEVLGVATGDAAVEEIERLRRRVHRTRDGRS